MLSTVLILVMCALTAIAGVPLILKLVPPNELFGVLTEKALSREEIWYEVNRFGGWALVAAAAVTVLALIIWANTLLRPFWLQIVVFLLPLAVAIGATLWYERQVDKHGKRRRRHK
jgi:uncharacterized membrane protein